MAEIAVFYEGPIVTRAEARLLGLKRYFTGRPCKHGHIIERDIWGNCVACARIWLSSEEWKTQNREWHRRYRQTEKGKAAYKRAQDKFRKTEKGKISRRTDIRISGHVRRARQRDLGGVFTKADEEKLRAHQKKCHICGKPFTKTNPATLDHVIAIADNGTNDPSNLALAHRACNARKNKHRTHLI